MRVLLDTNVLISAARNPAGTPYKAFRKAVTFPNTAYITDQNIEELRRVFSRKWPAELPVLNNFISLLLMTVELIHIPAKKVVEESIIRDLDDRAILRAALSSDIEVLITGDKDFLEADLTKPLVLSPAAYLQYE